MNLPEAANALRALAAQRIDTPESLAAWHEEARQLQLEFARSGLASHIPHIVGHYLNDVDIRVRDSAYGKRQEAQLQEALAQMERIGAI
jgi:hypothetical protein